MAATSKRESWTAQLEYLESAVAELLSAEPAAAQWSLLLEYEIPRRQRRIDAVLLAGTVIFAIEFKVGATTFERASVWQVEDYALDLRDFHSASRGRPIVPVLVATAATTPAGAKSDAVLRVGQTGLANAILDAHRSHSTAGPPIDAAEWDASGYRPTPTIIEATRRLFAGHSVRDLSHSYADNLTLTTDAVAAAVERGAGRAGAGRVLHHRRSGRGQDARGAVGGAGVPSRRRRGGRRVHVRQRAARPRAPRGDRPRCAAAGEGDRAARRPAPSGRPSSSSRTSTNSSPSTASSTATPSRPSTSLYSTRRARLARGEARQAARDRVGL